MKKHKILISFNILKNIFLYKFLLALFFLISFFYYTSSYSQDAQFSAEIIEKEAKKRVISVEQLKSMGIDPSNPQQAIEKARQMGISEAQIRDVLQIRAHHQVKVPDRLIPGAFQQYGSPLLRL